VIDAFLATSDSIAELAAILGEPRRRCSRRSRLKHSRQRCESAVQRSA
jgi:hypothetical protein